MKSWVDNSYFTFMFYQYIIILRLIAGVDRIVVHNL